MDSKIKHVSATGSNGTGSSMKRKKKVHGVWTIHNGIVKSLSTSSSSASSLSSNGSSYPVIIDNKNPDLQLPPQSSSLSNTDSLSLGGQDISLGKISKKHSTYLNKGVIDPHDPLAYDVDSLSDSSMPYDKKKKLKPSFVDDKYPLLFNSHSSPAAATGSAEGYRFDATKEYDIYERTPNANSRRSESPTSILSATSIPFSPSSALGTTMIRQSKSMSRLNQIKTPKSKLVSDFEENPIEVLTELKQRIAQKYQKQKSQMNEQLTQAQKEYEAKRYKLAKDLQVLRNQIRERKLPKDLELAHLSKTKRVFEKGEKRFNKDLEDSIRRIKKEKFEIKYQYYQQTERIRHYISKITKNNFNQPKLSKRLSNPDISTTIQSLQSKENNQENTLKSDSTLSILYQTKPPNEKIDDDRLDEMFEKIESEINQALSSLKRPVHDKIRETIANKQQQDVTTNNISQTTNMTEIIPDIQQIPSTTISITTTSTTSAPLMVHPNSAFQPVALFKPKPINPLTSPTSTISTSVEPTSNTHIHIYSDQNDNISSITKDIINKPRLRYQDPYLIVIGLCETGVTQIEELFYFDQMKPSLERAIIPISCELINALAVKTVIRKLNDEYQNRPNKDCPVSIVLSFSEQDTNALNMAYILIELFKSASIDFNSCWLVLSSSIHEDPTTVSLCRRILDKFHSDEAYFSAMSYVIDVFYPNICFGIEDNINLLSRRRQLLISLSRDIRHELTSKEYPLLFKGNQRSTFLPSEIIQPVIDDIFSSSSAFMVRDIKNKLTNSTFKSNLIKRIEAICQPLPTFNPVPYSFIDSSQYHNNQLSVDRELESHPPPKLVSITDFPKSSPEKSIGVRQNGTNQQIVFPQNAELPKISDDVPHQIEFNSMYDPTDVRDIHDYDEDMINVQIAGDIRSNTSSDDINSLYRSNDDLSDDLPSDQSDPSERSSSDSPTDIPNASYSDESDYYDWNSKSTDYIKDLLSHVYRYTSYLDRNVERERNQDPIPVSVFVEIEQRCNPPRAEFLQIHNKMLFDAVNDALISLYPKRFSSDILNQQAMANNIKAFIAYNRDLPNTLEELQDAILEKIQRWDKSEQGPELPPLMFNEESGVVTFGAFPPGHKKTQWTMTAADRMDNALRIDVREMEPSYLDYRQEEMLIAEEIVDRVFDESLHSMLHEAILDYIS